LSNQKLKPPLILSILTYFYYFARRILEFGIGVYDWEVIILGDVAAKIANCQLLTKNYESFF
jgi:hypothetical protein